MRILQYTEVVRKGGKRVSLGEYDKYTFIYQLYTISSRQIFPKTLKSLTAYVLISQHVWRVHTKLGRTDSQAKTCK